MKLSDIVEVVAKELGTSDMKEINKLLKAEPALKFRITGKALGHFGFTGQIKSISEEGVKVFMTNKVSLIRIDDIETFAEAKPRSERPVRPPKEKAAPVSVKASGKGKATAKMDDDFDDDDFDDEDDDFEDDLPPKKLKKKKPTFAGKGGSKFIPSGKK